MRTRGSTRTRGKQGITLVEVAISLTLMSVIGGALFLATDSASSAFRTGITVAEVNARALRALERVCEDLKSSSSDLTTPQPVAPFFGTSVDYQRGTEIDANGDLVFGPPERFELEYEETDDGIDNDGDGLVDECRLVWSENPGVAGERRVVVATGIREFLQGEDFDGADENGNGLIDEPGFCLLFGADRVTVRISFEDRDGEGHVIVTTVERTVAFRNEGV